MRGTETTNGGLRLLGVLLAVALLAAPGTARPAADAAIEAIGPSGLALQPAVPWDRAFLVVVGPKGFQHEQTFEAGAAIGFSGLDAGGDLLPDGGYKYELRLTLVGDRSTDAAEKASAAGIPVATHTGSFRMENGGLIAYPSERDAAGAAPAEEAAIVSDNPPTPPNAANHFNGSITTTGRICSGGADCSAGYTPVDSLELIDAGIPEVSFRDDLQNPSRYWEIEALNTGLRINDNLSGNTNVVFIEENAPSDSLRIDEFGRVGIGTSTPGQELHTFDTFINDFRMENLFSGLHSQWSLSADENRFQIEDEENGTTPFRIEFGAPSTMINLDNTGNVGINTFSPLAKLHVVGGPGGNVAIVEGGALAVQRFDGISANIRFEAVGQSWLFQNQPSDGSFNIRDQTNSVTPVRVFPNGSGATLVVRNGRLGLGVVSPGHPIDSATGARLTAGGVWQNASSRELKEDIQELSPESALEALDGLQPVTFSYKVSGAEQHVGFIAEEVPDLVASSDRKTLASMDVVAVLTQVVKQQQREIAELREMVTTRRDAK